MSPSGCTFTIPPGGLVVGTGTNGNRFNNSSSSA